MCLKVAVASFTQNPLLLFRQERLRANHFHCSLVLLHRVSSATSLKGLIRA